MSSTLLLLQFIIALAALIIVHELGHFVAAKLCHIKVHEFGIGFPPRLARLFKIGETEFTINWIPLGGFVRPAGENDPSMPNGLAAASPWARLFVLASGPAMNLLAALVLYAIIFLQIGRPDLNVVEIMEVSAGSPAAQAGLQPGDTVLQVNGEPINSSEELRDLIYANLGKTLVVVYQRDGVQQTTTLVPRDPPPADGAIGIAMGHPSLPINAPEAVWYGGRALYDQINTLVSFPGRLLRGEVSPDQGRLVGYKGMFDIYTEVREADASPESALPAGVNTLSFFASISASLAILNLLPIPALDGGRILFTLPEILFRKRVPAVYENAINLIGLALLLLFVVYINLQDFLNPISVP